MARQHLLRQDVPVVTQCALVVISALISQLASVPIRAIQSVRMITIAITFRMGTISSTVSVPQRQREYLVVLQRKGRCAEHTRKKSWEKEFASDQKIANFRQLMPEDTVLYQDRQMGVQHVPPLD